MNTTFIGASKKPADDHWRAISAFGSYAFVVAILLLTAFLHHATTRATALPLDPACARWDHMAADVVAHLVHEPTDASLRQAGDALFRMRRGRSNCRSGWLALSCQEYHAIVRLRANAAAGTSASKSPCSLAMRE
jgi:hypothetical protein